MSAITTRPAAEAPLFLAELPDADRLLAAAAALHREGFTRFDAHSPVPVHGMEKAMGLKSSPLGWIALGGGLATAAGWIGFLVYGSLDYPINHSGKPIVAPETMVPSAYMVTLIGTAFSILGGFMALSGLPRLAGAWFHSKRFVEASGDDGYFISVRTDDPKFDEGRLRALLAEHGATGFETAHEED